MNWVYSKKQAFTVIDETIHALSDNITTIYLVKATNKSSVTLLFLTLTGP
jgi:hypothetical protein